LKGVSVAVKPREFIAIQGPSGAGKSTLLHILGGLDIPTGGNVLFEGKDMYSLAERERVSFRNRSMGFVFQFYHLLPELNALENVALPGLFKSWWDRKKTFSRARHLLERVGLAERLTHVPGELSGGEQQRVAIARALINEPALLLCDEPTGNLDSENGRKILELLKQLNNEFQTTVIMVTHDREIAEFSSRVIFLKDGLIVNP
ncbi:MAG: ABC transporter ATP-binding protein, partial [Candidatus Omnitrophica bacterium]|nr:ABC transporter ATP-binding protein [Candidatus Omnitrophota bacterium]